MNNSLTWNQVAAFRQARHHLISREDADLDAVTRGVCGIQAQVMGAARVALWARIADLNPADIDVALREKRTLIKTSCMRQTLHLLTADDYPIYIAALRQSRVAAVHRIMSRFGVTQKEVEKLNDLVLATLDGCQLPQREVNRRIKPKVGKRVQKWMENTWSVLRMAQAQGLICYGNDQGNQINYVRVDQWLPPLPKIDESEAKQILLRRYLSAYGPATARDFAHWSGMSMKETIPVWESMVVELKEVSIEGEGSWIRKDDFSTLVESKKTRLPLKLLPGFDPYLLAHAQKDHLVERRHYKRVYRNQGWITPVIISHGRIIGVWSENPARKIQVELFDKATKAIMDEIRKESAKLESFLGSRRNKSKARGVD